MSEKQKKQNSLLRSSININSIRDSVSTFSESIKRSGVIARDIVKTTRERNIRNRKLIGKENEYFRRRRENIRRRDREDELEAKNITGASNRKENIITKSTKGLLGRILDFFGLILLGWFVDKLPGILKGITGLIKRIQGAVKFLTDFIDGTKLFLTGIGETLQTAVDSLPKFDFLNFKNEADKSLKKTDDVLKKINLDFFRSSLVVKKDVDEIRNNPEIDSDTGELKYPKELEDAMNQSPTDGNGGDNVEEGPALTGVEDGGVESGFMTTDSTGESIEGMNTSGGNEDNLLVIEETQVDKDILENLEKLDKESDKLKKNEEELRKDGKLDSANEGLNTSTSGNPGSSNAGAGNFTDLKLSEKPGGQRDDNDVNDNDDRTVPTIGDYYFKSDSRGGKYYILQSNGVFRKTNVVPKSGKRFDRSKFNTTDTDDKKLVSVTSNDKNFNIGSLNPNEIYDQGFIEGLNSNMFLNPTKKSGFVESLKMMKNKNLPTLIFKEAEMEQFMSNVSTTSEIFTSEIKSNDINSSFNLMQYIVFDKE